MNEFANRTGAPLRVLVVEDDFILASGLRAELIRMDAEVVGPFGDIHEAIQHIGNIDAAILDVRVREETAFPIADCLLNSRTPFLFYTAFAKTDIPGRFGNIERFSKPTEGRLLMRHLQQRRQSVREEPPADVAAALPRLRLEARQLMPEDNAADRLVEATLQRAIDGRLALPERQDRLERWFIDLLLAEYRRNGWRMMN